MAKARSQKKSNGTSNDSGLNFEARWHTITKLEKAIRGKLKALNHV